MYVKVCGFTHCDDIAAALDAGVDVIGLNFIPESKRFVPPELARQLVTAVGSAAICVGIVANLSLPELHEIRTASGVTRLQLHGNEPDEWTDHLAPWAFRAARVATEADVREASGMRGHPLLVDAKVEGTLGGTGKCIDWPLLTNLAKERPLVLAGGLRVENVAKAVQIVQPFGVDVASGVEVSGQPRRKDPFKMKEFVHEAREASSGNFHSSSDFLQFG